MKYNHLNVEFIEELTKIKEDNGKSLWENASDLFFASYDSLLSDLSISISEKNKLISRNIAHSFRSSSGNIGLMSLSSLFSKIDDICSKKDSEPDWILVADYFNKIQASSDEALLEVKDFKRNLL